MSSFMAKSTVTSILNDSDTQKIKAFAFNGSGFDPRTFQVLASVIDQGKITVEYDSDKDGMAEYDYNSNTIILGFRWCFDYTKKALVLHECTHAVYDVANRKMTVGVSEAIAYIVQCQYLIAMNGDGKRLTSSNKAKDLVFKLAWKIAAKIQNDKSVDASEKTALINALALHPYYLGKTSQDAGFNGV